MEDGRCSVNVVISQLGIKMNLAGHELFKLNLLIRRQNSFFFSSSTNKLSIPDNNVVQNIKFSIEYLLKVLVVFLGAEAGRFKKI